MNSGFQIVDAEKVVKAANDPEWIGQIHEVNIYDGALEPGEVQFLWQQ